MTDSEEEEGYNSIDEDEDMFEMDTKNTTQNGGVDTSSQYERYWEDVMSVRVDRDIKRKALERVKAEVDGRENRKRGKDRLVRFMFKEQIDILNEWMAKHLLASFRPERLEMFTTIVETTHKIIIHQRAKIHVLILNLIWAYTQEELEQVLVPYLADGTLASICESFNTCGRDIVRSPALTPVQPTNDNPIIYLHVGNPMETDGGNKLNRFLQLVYAGSGAEGGRRIYLEHKNQNSRLGHSTAHYTSFYGNSSISRIGDNEDKVPSKSIPHKQSRRQLRSHISVSDLEEDPYYLIFDFNEGVPDILVGYAELIVMIGFRSLSLESIWMRDTIEALKLTKYAPGWKGCRCRIQVIIAVLFHIRYSAGAPNDPLVSLTFAYI